MSRESVCNNGDILDVCYKYWLQPITKNNNQTIFSCNDNMCAQKKPEVRQGIFRKNEEFIMKKRLLASVAAGVLALSVLAGCAAKETAAPTDNR